jgi:hypothetical protein
VREHGTVKKAPVARLGEGDAETRLIFWPSAEVQSIRAAGHDVEAVLAADLPRDTSRSFAHGIIRGKSQHKV